VIALNLNLVNIEHFYAKTSQLVNI